QRTGNLRDYCPARELRHRRCERGGRAKGDVLGISVEQEEHHHRLGTVELQGIREQYEHESGELWRHVVSTCGWGGRSAGISASLHHDPGCEFGNQERSDGQRQYY